MKNSLVRNLLIIIGLLLTQVNSAFAVGPSATGSYATPDGGESNEISFKLNNNTDIDDFQFGFFVFNSISYSAFNGGCFTLSCYSNTIGNARIPVVIPPNGRTPIANIGFSAVESTLQDSTSRFALVLDGSGAFWVINRLSGDITTENSQLLIGRCLLTDDFDPAFGCISPLPPKVLDIDLDGEVLPLTDGLLMLRYLFGFRGEILTSRVIGAFARRDTIQIEIYLDTLIGLDDPVFNILKITT